jgi:hypothetical protein
MKTGIAMQFPKQVLVTDVVARDGFQSAKENEQCHSILKHKRS